MDAGELEQANRTIASHLGGDPASVDAARILRPAGTVSHKHRPQRRSSCCTATGTRYEVAELVDGLGAGGLDDRARARRPERAARTELDELLLAIPTATYVRELAGLRPRRDGKVNCPFHADAIPSLQLYKDGTFYCYGCGAGGSIYNFAGTLWNLATKGRAFLDSARLADFFRAVHRRPSLSRAAAAGPTAARSRLWSAIRLIVPPAVAPTSAASRAHPSARLPRMTESGSKGGPPDQLVAHPESFRFAVPNENDRGHRRGCRVAGLTVVRGLSARWGSPPQRAAACPVGAVPAPDM